jgi:hypothetical protein
MEEMADGSSPRRRALRRVNVHIEIRRLDADGNDIHRRIRGTSQERESEIVVGPQVVPAEEQVLNFRREGAAGNVEASVRLSELGQWIEDLLVLDNDGGRPKEEKNEEERGCGFHRNMAICRFEEVVRVGGDPQMRKIRHAVAVGTAKKRDCCDGGSGRHGHRLPARSEGRRCRRGIGKNDPFKTYLRAV